MTLLIGEMIDVLQVARLFRRKFRPLDTDTEGARASKTKWLLVLSTSYAKTHEQIDSARGFILPFCKRICSNNSGRVLWGNSRIGLLGIDGIRVLLGAVPFSE